MRKFNLDSLKFCIVDSEGNFYQATETKQEADYILRRGLYRSGFEGIQPVLSGLPEHCRIVPFILDKDSRPISKSTGSVEVLRGDKWVKVRLVDVDGQGVVVVHGKRTQEKYYQFYSWDECRSIKEEGIPFREILAC